MKIKLDEKQLEKILAVTTAFNTHFSSFVKELNRANDLEEEKRKEASQAKREVKRE